MDVKAPAKTPPAANLPVKQAPAEPPHGADGAADAESAAAEPADTAAQTPAAQPATPKVEHRLPVGIIVVTLCFMVGMAAIAVAIYLKSQQ